MNQLPDGWTSAPLEELLAVEERPIADGPFGSKLASRHYTESGARVIRLQNIGDGYFKDERAYISLDYYAELRAHEVRTGDLVIASLGDVLPRACVIPELGEPGIVKADCVRARIHPLVETRWVLYALLSPQVRQYAASRIRGVGRPRLGLGEIRKLPIPVAPIDEQRRVVSALDDYLSRLEAARRYLDHASGRLDSLSKSWRSLDIAGGQSGVKPGSPLNAGWTWGYLGDLIERIEAGKSFTCEPRRAGEGEWGVIKVSAMTWGEFRDQENKAVPLDRSVDPRHEIKPGDILVSRANTEAYVGAPVLVHDCRPRLLLSDKSLRLIPKDGTNKEWLVQALASPLVRRQISAASTGNQESMRNISQGALSAISIPIPPEPDMKAIADNLRDVSRVIRRQEDQAERTRRRCEALRRAVLADAFSGRLVPPHAEAESAALLLERIREERASAPRSSRRRAAATGIQKGSA